MTGPKGAVAVVGIGMTPFGRYLDSSLKDLAAPAIHDALADALFTVEDIDMAFVANAMSAVITGQGSVVGQSVLRAAGFSGIPVYNIDNACAGSSSALELAVQAVRAGAATTVLVLGVEKLYSQDRTKTYRALNGAGDLDGLDLEGLDLERESVFVGKVYPQRIAVFRKDYALDPEILAAIAVKNRSHASLNPLAQYVNPLDVEQVLEARMVVDPITTLMCAPISDGASAAIVTSRDLANQDGRRPIWVAGAAVGMAGNDGVPAVRRVASTAYERAGVSPADVDVAEVHDSISFNELLAYRELGLCEPGDESALVRDGETSLGGRIPVNTSGGLESRGHPIAATGLAQIFELVTQLRGEAGERQVPDPTIGLAENSGGYAGGETAAVAVTILTNDTTRLST